MQARDLAVYTYALQPATMCARMVQSFQGTGARAVSLGMSQKLQCNCVTVNLRVNLQSQKKLHPTKFTLF